VAHEVLDRGVSLPVPHEGGELRLQVEGDLVRLASGQVVEVVADSPDEVAGAAKFPHLLLGEQRPGEQVGDAGYLESGPGRP
jgi:hypothetical protein